MATIPLELLIEVRDAARRITHLACIEPAIPPDAVSNCAMAIGRLSYYITRELRPIVVDIDTSEMK